MPVASSTVAKTSDSPESVMVPDVSGEKQTTRAHSVEIHRGPALLHFRENLGSDSHREIWTTSTVRSHAGTSTQTEQARLRYNASELGV